VRAQPAELHGFVLEVEIDDWTRVAAKRGPRKHPPDRAAEIERHVKLLGELGVIQQVHDVAYYSQEVLLVPKPGGKWRFCIDFRPLNSVSASDAGHPLPLIQLLGRLGNKRFKILAKMDLTSGYHQILMDPATRHFAAFITESGIYVPNRLMFGVKCAPSYFQGHMTKTVLLGLIEYICEITSMMWSPGVKQSTNFYIIWKVYLSDSNDLELHSIQISASSAYPKHSSWDMCLVRRN
jgi:hypothetical protein